jgi:hypothetical protein
MPGRKLPSMVCVPAAVEKNSNSIGVFSCEGSGFRNEAGGTVDGTGELQLDTVLIKTKIRNPRTIFLNTFSTIFWSRTVSLLNCGSAP